MMNTIKFVESSFCIEAANVLGAFELIKAVSKDYFDNSKIQDLAFSDENLKAAFLEWGLLIETDISCNITNIAVALKADEAILAKSNYDDLSDFWDALAPFIKDDSYIRAHTDDGQNWTWVFCTGEVDLESEPTDEEYATSFIMEWLGKHVDASLEHPDADTWTVGHKEGLRVAGKTIVELAYALDLIVNTRLVKSN